MSLNLPWNVRDLSVAHDKLLTVVKQVAQGMGNLSLEMIGDAGVLGIYDGKQRAIYLECFVKIARDVLKELGEDS